MISGDLRVGTASEQSQWRRARQKIDDIGDLLWALRGKAQLAQLAYRWGITQEIDCPNPEQLENELLSLETSYKKIKSAVEKVDNRVFALQFRNGDIDIVNPSQDMSGVFLVIVGVAVAGIIISGLGALSFKLWEEGQKTNRKYNSLLKATDSVFCDPKSPKTCAEWEKTKREYEYEEKKDTLDRVVDGIGKAAATGSKWGLAVAIPLLVGALLWRQRS